MPCMPGAKEKGIQLLMFPADMVVRGTGVSFQMQTVRREAFAVRAPFVPSRVQSSLYVHPTEGRGRSTFYRCNPHFPFGGPQGRRNHAFYSNGA
jgi:hypothetical protein